MFEYLDDNFRLK